MGVNSGKKDLKEGMLQDGIGVTGILALGETLSKRASSDTAPHTHIVLCVCRHTDVMFNQSYTPHFTQWCQSSNLGLSKMNAND